MKVWQASLPGVWLIQPTVHADSRGQFFERFNAQQFENLTDYPAPRFVQTCESLSAYQHTVRSLHFQISPRTQGKLVWVQQGAVRDVVLDVRDNSPTFGKHEIVELTADNRLQLWIPPGFAHGFATLADNTVFQYQVTDFYSPEHERCIAWNDPDLAIDWGFNGTPLVSAKDAQAMSWAEFRKSVGA